MISVVILTQNEEADLPSCLESLSWCDDIQVLDSGSTDHTVDIAKKFNATIRTNTFTGFGNQRNFALDSMHLKYDWVLFLDADERSTEDFKHEILYATTHAGPEIAGFYNCSKLMLEGKWLKHSDTFPKWQFRLLRKGRARYLNLGHGQKECSIDGTIGYIKEGYLHYGMSKGWHKWIERHNNYSTLEAAVRYYHCPPFKDIFVRHQSKRNVALKSWLSKFPGWPFLRFFHAYFLNLGFLEGTQGFLYCINNFYYEWMISIKYRELKNKDQQSSYAGSKTHNNTASLTISQDQ